MVFPTLLRRGSLHRTAVGPRLDHWPMSLLGQSGAQSSYPLALQVNLNLTGPVFYLTDGETEAPGREGPETSLRVIRARFLLSTCVAPACGHAVEEEEAGVMGGEGGTPWGLSLGILALPGARVMHMEAPVKGGLGGTGRVRGETAHVQKGAWCRSPCPTYRRGQPDPCPKLHLQGDPSPGESRLGD